MTSLFSSSGVNAYFGCDVTKDTRENGTLAGKGMYWLETGGCRRACGELAASCEKKALAVCSTRFDGNLVAYLVICRS